jgi:hypothetical protein
MTRFTHPTKPMKHFVAFDGYEQEKLEITKKLEMYDLKIVLESEEVSQEVKILEGKTLKNNILQLIFYVKEKTDSKCSINRKYFRV